MFFLQSELFDISRAVNEDDADALRKFILDGIDVLGIIEGVSVLECYSICVCVIYYARQMDTGKATA